MAIHEINWDVCIRTGGPEGPLLFNLSSCALWRPVFGDWDSRGVGSVLECVCGEYERRLTVDQFVWADTCYLVSSSSSMLAQMIHDLTLPLHNRGMRWNNSSLLHMTCGELATVGCNGEILTRGDLVIPACTQFESFSLRRVCKISVLGQEIYF
eukprot:8912537-Pyramimonas_sp.AAC.1